MREMMRDRVIMSKVDHFGFHNYAANAGNAYKAIKIPLILTGTFI
jgi:hypothetical protein